jgi:MYXO-CTERM domain-containing protein
VHRVGILVAVALVAHVWMMQAAGAPAGPATAPEVATSADAPVPAHCPHVMVACRVQAPPETGDELVWAVLLAVAAMPVAGRRRRLASGAARGRPARRPLPRLAIPASVVLLD